MVIGHEEFKEIGQDEELPKDEYRYTDEDTRGAAIYNTDIGFERPSEIRR